MKISAIDDNIISLWLHWYFIEAPKEILKGWKNFLLFNLNYFSVPLLLKTLFSHWKKYYWQKTQRGFDLGEYFTVLFSNLMSRFLGAIVRLFLIIFGLFVEVLIFFIGLIIFLGWFLLPLFWALGLFIGFGLLINIG